MTIFGYARVQLQGGKGRDGSTERPHGSRDEVLVQLLRLAADVTPPSCCVLNYSLAGGKYQAVTLINVDI